MKWIYGVAALLAASGTAAGQVVWDEAVDGDLSDDELVPTVVALSAGSNIVRGTVGGASANSPPEDFFDAMTITVPAGLSIQQVTLNSYVTAGGNTTSGFNVATGTSWDGDFAAANFVGSGQFSVANIGLNVLPGGTQPDGDYVLSVREGTPGQVYEFDIVIGGVIDPCDTPADAAVTCLQGGSPFGIFYTSSTGDVVGFRFEVTEEITVTDLGVYSANGLASDHEVGIWDNSENLLTSNVVGPNDPSDGQWNFAPTTNATLSPGELYTIGVVYTATDGDSYVSGPTIMNQPEVTVLNAVFPSSGDLGLVFPLSDSFGNLGRYGPNFKFSTGDDCSCAADLTGDTCGTNTNDFFQFLALYQAQDPAADFSPGGGINTNDFFAYLAAYQADLNNPDCPG